MKNLDLGVGPEGYHKKYYADRDWQRYTPLLGFIIENVQPGKILDLGAGCGYFVEAASRWGLQCVGLEGSPEAVNMAKARDDTLDIHLHKLSESFPFDSNMFRTILLNQVVEHLEPETLDHVLRESYRVLGENGVIVITSPSKFNRYERKIDPTHINMLSPSELNMLVRRAGFLPHKQFNTPLPLLGRNRVSRKLMAGLFGIFKADFLSESANLVAYKQPVRF